MSTCPECSGPVWIQRTAYRKNGEPRRRLECRKCGYRWTEHNGPSRVTGPARLRLGADAIRDIVAGGKTKRQLAEKYGIGTATVGRIRHEWHKGQPQTITAEPAAITGPSCLLCVHYNGNPGNPCGLGHPDPIEEGLGFAVDCSTYIEAS